MGRGSRRNNLICAIPHCRKTSSRSCCSRPWRRPVRPHAQTHAAQLRERCMGPLGSSARVVRHCDRAWSRRLPSQRMVSPGRTGKPGRNLPALAGVALVAPVRVSPRVRPQTGCSVPPPSARPVAFRGPRSAHTGRRRSGKRSCAAGCNASPPVSRRGEIFFDAETVTRQIDRHPEKGIPPGRSDPRARQISSLMIGGGLC